MSRAEHTVKNREPWLNDSQWLGDEATHNTGVWQREIVDVQSGHRQPCQMTNHRQVNVYVHNKGFTVEK